MNRMLVSLAALLLMTTVSLAQPAVGSVWGTVVDADGGPVAQAVVKLHVQVPPDTCGGCGGNGSGECDGSGQGAGNGNGNGYGGWTVVQAITDNAGVYLIPEIPVGIGWARACKPTVGNACQTVEITAGPNQIDFQLTPGGKHVRNVD